MEHDSAECSCAMIEQGDLPLLDCLKGIGSTERRKTRSKKNGKGKEIEKKGAQGNYFNG